MRRVGDSPSNTSEFGTSQMHVRNVYPDSDSIQIVCSSKEKTNIIISLALVVGNGGTTLSFKTVKPRGERCDTRSCGSEDRGTRRQDHKHPVRMKVHSGVCL